MKTFSKHFPAVLLLLLIYLSVGVGCTENKNNKDDSDDLLEDCYSEQYHVCLLGEDAIRYFINQCRFAFEENDQILACREFAYDCSDCAIECYENSEGCYDNLDCLIHSCNLNVKEDSETDHCVEADFIGYSTSCSEKPNIYLYPEKTIEVSVELIFNQGSYLTWNWPEYDQGWHVTVEPGGLIDGMYPYLFYEASIAGYLQKDRGAVVNRDELFDWLEGYLFDVGFIDREVGDFMLFWTGELEERNWYAIYPQWDPIIDEMIGLAIQPKPDSIMRLWLIIEGFDEKPERLDLETPIIEPFDREGFTVVEWGVIRNF